MEKVKIRFKKDYELLGVVVKQEGDILEVIRSDRHPFKWETFGEGINCGIEEEYAEEVLGNIY